MSRDDVDEQTTQTVLHLIAAERQRRHALWPASAVLPYLRVAIGSERVWTALEPPVMVGSLWLCVRAITDWQTGETQQVLISKYAPVVVTTELLKGPAGNSVTWTRMVGTAPFRIVGYKAGYSGRRECYHPGSSTPDEHGNVDAVTEYLEAEPSAWLLAQLAAGRKD